MKDKLSQKQSDCNEAIRLVLELNLPILFEQHYTLRKYALGWVESYLLNRKRTDFQGKTKARRVHRKYMKQAWAIENAISIHGLNDAILPCSVLTGRIDNA